MYPETTPSRRKGKRNIWCKDYNGCLDYAIDNSWQSWGCGECKHRLEQCSGIGVISTNSDATEYYEIPRIIYENTL